MFPETLILEDRITFENTIDFSLDKEKNALSILRERHENKCYPGGAYILSINKVISLSPIFIEQLNQEGRSYVNCIFEATVKKYRPGDILPLCKVKHFGSILESINKDNTVVFREDPIYESVSNGNIVPAVIQTANGFQNRPTVNITAKMYKPVGDVVFLMSESQEPDLKKIESSKAEKQKKTKNNPQDFRSLFFRPSNSKKGEDRALIYNPLKQTVKIDRIEAPEGALNFESEEQVKRVIKIYDNLVEENENYWTTEKMKENKMIWTIYKNL